MNANERYIKMFGLFFNYYIFGHRGRVMSGTQAKINFQKSRFKRGKGENKNHAFPIVTITIIGFILSKPRYENASRRLLYED